MRVLIFIIPALVGTTIIIMAMVLRNAALRQLVGSILMLLWALIRLPFEAFFGLFRRK